MRPSVPDPQRAFVHAPATRHRTRTWAGAAIEHEASRSPGIRAAVVGTVATKMNSLEGHQLRRRQRALPVAQDRELPFRVVACGALDGRPRVRVAAQHARAYGRVL